MTRNRATNPIRRPGQSAGRAGKPTREAVGRSRGGLTRRGRDRPCCDTRSHVMSELVEEVRRLSKT